MDRLVISVALVLLAALFLSSDAPEPAAGENPEPALAREDVAKEDWWIESLPPRCVVICRQRGDQTLIRGVQADLAKHGWCTVTLDLQAAPSVARRLGASGPSLVCVCDANVIGVLPPSATVRDVADLFRERLAASSAAYTGMVYYTADWCVACRRFQPIVEALQKEGFPVRVVRVGDSLPSGVDSLPTFDFIRDGKRTAKLSGAASERDIRRQLMLTLGMISSIPQPRRAWTVDGDTSPSREKLVAHLLEGAAHKGKFTRSELEPLTREELMRLHSADHEGLTWSK